MTEEEIETELTRLRKEKQFFEWLFKEYTINRCSGHFSRSEHCRKMEIPLPKEPVVYDLYYTTSDKLKGEDFMLFNYPSLWIEYIKHG